MNEDVKFIQDELLNTRILNNVAIEELADKINISPELLYQSEQNVEVFGNLDYSVVCIWARALGREIVIGDK